jgi:hypothetical protein
MAQEGRLISFASIEWIGYLAETPGRLGHVAITCHGLLIRITGRSLQRLVAAFQRGEVDFIQSWGAEAWDEPPPAPEPMVDTITFTRRATRP